MSAVGLHHENTSEGCYVKASCSGRVWERSGLERKITLSLIVKELITLIPLFFGGTSTKLQPAFLCFRSHNYSRLP